MDDNETLNDALAWNARQLQRSRHYNKPMVPVYEDRIMKLEALKELEDNRE